MRSVREILIIAFALADVAIFFVLRAIHEQEEPQRGSITIYDLPSRLEG